ncbi:MAG TPA: hypothetical protein VM285_09340, partial [Polyangia bacterium]|nr:hypothetical protein [Polyangia bacterium]
TPQPEDEMHFRTKAGLPGMSEAVREAWDDDAGVRRPVTLVQSTAAKPPPAPAPEPGAEQ